MAAPRHVSGIGTPEKHTACIDCGIRLVSAYYYRRNMPADEKGQHGVQFGVHVGGGRCGKCGRRHRRGGTMRNAPNAGRIYSDDELAYDGGWVRRGLILVPVKRGAA